MSMLLSRLSARLTSSLFARRSATCLGASRSIVLIAENDAELREIVKKNDNKLVIIDWYAQWCAPCRMFAPTYEKMSDAAENANVVFVKADIDELPEASAEAGIQSIPTFHFIKKGQLVGSVTGANQTSIKEIINKHK